MFQKLEKSKLPILVHLWPEIAQRLAKYDPGNVYAVNYMWGTTGIGYNVKKVREILGADAKLDSWDFVFKPEMLAKFKGCGVHFSIPRMTCSLQRCTISASIRIRPKRQTCKKPPIW